MKLLLDGLYPRRIAEQLRRRGHDAEAVSERLELRHLADAQVLGEAQREGRALATENVRDFALLAREYAGRGDVHFGLVFVDGRKYPRGAPRTVGRMVTALDRVLSANPADEATSFVHWL